MKKLLKSIKKARVAFVATNATAILLASIYVILTALGITKSGIWFPITIGVIGGIDLLATLLALSLFRLKSDF